jgi:hypothetical protein
LADSAPVQLDVKVVIAQAITALNTLVGKVQGTAKEIDTAFSSMNAAVTGFKSVLAGGGILAGLKSIDDMVSRVHTSVNEAANSMKNMGGSLNVDEIKDFINNLGQGSAAGVASITDLYNAVQTLGAHVTDTAQLERAMNDAVQLSAARHIDFATAVSMVGRVLSGHLTMLVRAGIITAD